MPDNMNPEMETMISASINVTQLTCPQLCEELSNDADLLQSLWEFPVKQQAAVRAALTRDMVAMRAELKQKKCPVC